MSKLIESAQTAIPSSSLPSCLVFTPFHSPTLHLSITFCFYSSCKDGKGRGGAQLPSPPTSVLNGNNFAPLKCLIFMFGYKAVLHFIYLLSLSVP